MLARWAWGVAPVACAHAHWPISVGVCTGDLSGVLAGVGAPDVLCRVLWLSALGMGSGSGEGNAPRLKIKDFQLRGRGEVFLFSKHCFFPRQILSFS